MKISNGNKSPAKGIGLVIIKIPKSNIIIPLFQHTICHKILKIQ